MANKLSQSPLAHEHVLAALDASSGALRALEAASAAIKSNPELRTNRDHMNHAIELLQDTVAEIRLAQNEDPHASVAGFILAVRRRRGKNQRPPDPPRD